MSDVLLGWCQRRTRGYDDVDVKNFGSSWASGLAFCAILHEQNVITVWEYANLAPGNHRENLEFAFEHAAKLGIPGRLTAEEMEQPDEARVMHYLGEWYYYFKERAGSLRDSATGLEEDLRSMLPPLPKPKPQPPGKLPPSPRPSAKGEGPSASPRPPPKNIDAVRPPSSSAAKSEGASRPVPPPKGDRNSARSSGAAPDVAAPASPRPVAPPKKAAAPTPAKAAAPKRPMSAPRQAAPPSRGPVDSSGPPEEEEEEEEEEEGRHAMLTGPKRASMRGKRRPPDLHQLKMQRASQAEGGESSDETAETSGIELSAPPRSAPAKAPSPRPFGGQGFAVSLDEIMAVKAKQAQKSPRPAAKAPLAGSAPSSPAPVKKQPVPVPGKAPAAKLLPAKKVAAGPTKGPVASPAQIPIKKAPKKGALPPATTPAKPVAAPPALVRIRFDFGDACHIVELEDSATPPEFGDAILALGYEDPGPLFLLKSDFTCEEWAEGIALKELVKGAEGVYKICCLLDEDPDAWKEKIQLQAQRLAHGDGDTVKKRVVMVQYLEEPQQKLLLTSDETGVQFLQKCLRKFRVPEITPGRISMGEKTFSHDEYLWNSLEEFGPTVNPELELVAMVDEVIEAEVLNLAQGELEPLEYGSFDTANDVLDRLSAPDDYVLYLMVFDRPDHMFLPDEGVAAIASWYPRAILAYGPQQVASTNLGKSTDSVAPLDDPFN